MEVNPNSRPPAIAVLATLHPSRKGKVPTQGGGMWADGDGFFELICEVSTPRVAALDGASPW